MKLTPKEASKYLGIAESTLQMWRGGKPYEIPFLIEGRYIFYLKKDLDEYKRQRQV